MRIIGFDTATDDTVVGAADGPEMVCESAQAPGEDGRPAHSEALLEAVERAVAGLGGWPRVDRIAVGVGPGTFTGLRIGIATANGLRLAGGKPLVPVSTLAALALTMKWGDDEPERPQLPVLDARRGEVFAALVDPTGHFIWAPFVCSPEDLGARISALAGGRGLSPRVAGPGAIRFRDELTRCGADVAGSAEGIHRLGGRAICVLGAGADPAPPDTTPEPDYLRDPDAQLWLERDSPDAET
ncbi:MAG: tRNA (adenosine(37)-N6)-threonylcarbamoyltransferase complex dimerization subunit type 1 TsaB [Acidobacteriota bacterium]